jgi:hypothetical protein
LLISHWCADYMFDYGDEGEKLPCLCGAMNCRGWMN